ncbi:pyridoxal phosphate-dependent aminotransferase [Ferrovibrio sp.]|uniref:pyridoxal phosphate-dependent aminotransferase n=1 Tax=Ferrovibrio sp. TaxID=1917215 RepID=UPI0025C4A959|nr:pyridoxal phosphate-dependent aminotransferase [Ferrovibrio sp.]MBX3452972.1 pyridoxal phosphate-dependent aminotransferase [Ferrovibrio sp.]
MNPQFPSAPIRSHIQAINGSRIRIVNRAAAGMSDVLPLWFGEGDDATPAFIADAAAEAVKTGKTFYAPNRGIPELRAAIQRYLKRTYDQDVAIERITVTASGMNALMIVTQCLLGPGDNGIVIGPVWPNGQQAMRVMGAEPRRVDLTPTAEGGWRLDLDRLFDACDENTRVISINSPGNPTGWVASEAELRAILDFCKSRGIWVLSDEVYSRIVYDRPYAPSFLTIADPDDPVVIVNSFSKSWSMTGWRLGWIIAPPRLQTEIEKMTEFNISHPTTFVQHGGIAAMDQGDAYTASLVARYGQARDLVFQRLAGLPRVRLARPEGAFYAFFAVDGMTDSLAFCLKLLETAKVGLAPGIAFGDSGEGRIRLCFAASLPKVSEAMDRLEPQLR